MSSASACSAGDKTLQRVRRAGGDLTCGGTSGALRFLGSSRERLYWVHVAPFKSPFKRTFFTIFI